MKKFLCLLVLLALGISSTFAATRSRGYDLVVAPARFSVMQVAMDVISTRSSVLVSYQGEANTAEPTLHVWNGTVWSPISLHDLRELSFLQKTPSRAILIGNDDLLPTSIRDGLAWLPEVVYIRDLSNASVLNEFGRLQSWSKREWAWYSNRYNLNLEDEAAPLRNRSWYDRPGPLKEEAATTTYQPAPVTSVRQPMMPPSSLPAQREIVRPSDVIVQPVPEPVAVAESQTLEVVAPTVDDAAMEANAEIVEEAAPVGVDSSSIK